MISPKNIIRFLFILGLVLLVVGFWHHPGIPYQDPPPELLKKYDNEARVADNTMQIGAWLIVIALIGRIAIALYRILVRNPI